MKIKKMRLIFGIMFFMLVMSFGDDVNAQEVSGTCGADVVWTVRSDGSLTISGNGKMTDFGYGESPWYSAADLIQNITINGNIENIGKYAFHGCSSVTSITLPDSVISIGASAFRYCESLSSVTIPEGVTYINSDAFYGCSQLKDIYYQGTLSDWCKINFNNLYSTPMFYGDNLYISDKLLSGELTIPGDITNVENYTFYGCSALTDVIIPDNVTSIGEYAFSDCKSLTSIIIPDSVIGIGSAAFSGCIALTDVAIPDNVTSIKDNMFNGCKSLTSIIISDNVTSIGEKVFAHCKTLTDVVIPNSVKSIEKEAFEFSGLINVDIPDSVISIGEEAFYCCNDLVNVKLSSGMSKIEDKLFSNCISLKSISIPESITYIGFGAFYFQNRGNLEYIFYGGTLEQWDSVNIRYYTYGDNNELSDVIIHYSMLDHIWESDYTIDKEPTCAVAGSKSFHCNVCDAINNDSSVLIPVNDEHVIVLRNKKEPTCTSTGYTGDQVCTVCGEIIQSGTVIPVKERIEATGKFALLKSYLLEKGQTDDDGNKYFQDTVMVSAKRGNTATISYIEDEAKFKFCRKDISGNQTVSTITMYIEENGSQTVTVEYREYALSLYADATFDVSSYTSNGKVYFEQTASHILDNDQIQDLCNAGLKIAFDEWDLIFLKNLGYDVNMADMGFTSYEKAGTHTGDGVVTKRPTCYEKGIMTYTCIICGYVATEEIDTTPHQWNNKYTIDKKATRTESGRKSIHCSVCNTIKNGSVKIIPQNNIKNTQNIRVTTSKKISVNKLKNKAQSFKLSAKSTSGNRVKYKLVKKNKNIKFAASSGRVTVKKGTKKGTYKIKVKMTVSGNDRYEAYSTTKTITIKVK